jgi:anti-sigma28 factor (negative regulator of flagellin synthesis)
MATQQERNEARRKEKLEQIKEQVEDGSLVIRKMTPKERAANPPRPRPAKRGKRR